MTEEHTREPQYQRTVELRSQHDLTQFGLMSNQTWYDDPRRLVFLLSRYKFVSKMLSGKQNVLEVGCADAFGTRIVRQEIPTITAIDFDPVFVRDAQARMDPKWEIDCFQHDMLSGPVTKNGPFDAAYSMDVLEHIPPANEHQYITNIAGSLKEDGVLIVGSPSIQSQPYASQPSKEGHVNCKDAPGMKALMEAHFKNVFIFSMNDEVVHTGFYPMANYLIALCVSQK